MKNIAIIVGAGAGKRFGSNKQIAPIHGKAVYLYSLDVFVASGLFSKIYLVIQDELIGGIKKDISNGLYSKVVVCKGGKTRAESVNNAFKKIKNINSKVFIHDAARPLINVDFLKSIHSFTKNKTAVVVGKKINDTVRSVKNNYSEFTVDRTYLWTSETPQVFDYKILKDCYDKNIKNLNEFTDEASMVEYSEHKVEIFESENLNTKLTTQADLNTISKAMEGQTVSGIGLDFHSLVEGSEIVVGGHKIKCQFKSEAHSDGDVLTHAIIDALCGALNMGDIGQHFPNTNEFLNISSIELLKRIMHLIPSNTSILNIDASIVLNEPKIAPHRDKIIDSLCSVLNISKHQISIKGTTRNGLNFINMDNGWGAEVIIVLKKWN